MLVFDYSAEVKQLQECRDADIGFAATLNVLDKSSSYAPKMGWVDPGVYCGIQHAALPHLGAYRQIGLRYAGGFYRLVVCDQVRRAMTARTSAVVEIGCAAGEIIVSLARDHGGGGDKNPLHCHGSV